MMRSAREVRSTIVDLVLRGWSASAIAEKVMVSVDHVVTVREAVIKDALEYTSRERAVMRAEHYARVQHLAQRIDRFAELGPRQEQWALGKLLEVLKEMREVLGLALPASSVGDGEEPDAPTTINIVPQGAGRPGATLADALGGGDD